MGQSIGIEYSKQYCIFIVITRSIAGIFLCFLRKNGFPVQREQNFKFPEEGYRESAYEEHVYGHFASLCI